VTREETLEFLKKEEITRRKRSRVFIWVAIVLLAIQSGTLGYGIATKQSNLMDTVIYMAPLLCFFGFAAGMTPQAKNALDSLLETNDPALIGHLFEATAFYGEGTIPARIRQCLLTVLPKADETSLTLDEVQHSAMIAAVANIQLAKDDEFLVGIVRALPYIGRKETVPTLERLAAEGAKVSPAVRNAAIAALPELRIRIAKGIIDKASLEADSRRAEIERRLENTTAETVRVEA
jgi:hypothetical protein